MAGGRLDDDRVVSRTGDLLEAIKAAFATRVPADDVGGFFDAVNRYTTRGLARYLSTATREPMTIEDLLGWRRYELPAERAQFVAVNVDLIRSIDERYLDDVARVVAQSEREQWSTEQLRTELEARYGVSRSRAQLIAEDQISKVHGQVNQTRQIQAGFSEYIWRSVNDRHVRPLHQRRNGERFPWAIPPMEEPGDGYPGHPIRCRCFAEPVLNDAGVDG